MKVIEREQKQESNETARQKGREKGGINKK